jgi:hypothetical protein
LEWGKTKPIFESMDEVAPTLLNKPVLDEFSAFYINAFMDLSGMRQAGFNGPMRISIADIQAYCDMFEIDEREQFFYNMRAADDVYLEWVMKANK